MHEQRHELVCKVALQPPLLAPARTKLEVGWLWQHGSHAPPNGDRVTVVVDIKGEESGVRKSRVALDGMADGMAHGKALCSARIGCGVSRERGWEHSGVAGRMRARLCGKRAPRSASGARLFQPTT